MKKENIFFNKDIFIELVGFVLEISEKLETVESELENLINKLEMER
tara:strand:+ start:192 stop:329 length:138 start_codon:yes stop_codon:yes gene_type:complete